MGGASVFGPPRFNDADVGAAKELRLRGSRFSFLRRVVVGLLLLVVAEDVEEEAEEESLPFRISTKQIEYALGKKWRKNSTQKDSHKI